MNSVLLSSADAALRRHNIGLSEWIRAHPFTNLRPGDRWRYKTFYTSRVDNSLFITIVARDGRAGSRVVNLTMVALGNSNWRWVMAQEIRRLRAAMHRNRRK